jgi:hypothetical protein
MAREILYVTNFPPSEGIEEVLATLFSEFGGVKNVSFGLNERFDVTYVTITMETEKAATQANHSLNGYEIEGMRLSISYPDIDEAVVERGLSAKQRQTAEAVVKELGEEWRKPVRRIHTMILLCGHSFVLSILEEARLIYEGEGILTQDGSRLRTLGGVFFTLANWRMSPEIYKVVHTRGGKLYDYQKSDDRIFYHLIVNPHPEDMEAQAR